MQYCQTSGCCFVVSESCNDAYGKSGLSFDMVVVPNQRNTKNTTSMKCMA